MSAVFEEFSKKNVIDNFEFFLILAWSVKYEQEFLRKEIF